MISAPSHLLPREKFQNTSCCSPILGGDWRSWQAVGIRVPREMSAESADVFSHYMHTGAFLLGSASLDEERQININNLEVILHDIMKHL